MNLRRRAVTAFIVTIVLGVAALVPFGTSVAQSSAESDLGALIGELRSFQRDVTGNELSDDETRARAREAIGLKRAFILNTAGANDSDVTAYFDLKKIDDRLKTT